MAPASSPPGNSFYFYHSLISLLQKCKVLPPLGKGFILKSSVSRALFLPHTKEKKKEGRKKRKDFQRPYKIDLLLPLQNIHD